MKSLKLALSAIATATMVFGLTAYAAAEQDASYKVIAYKSCDVVTEFFMNKEQIEAMKSLEKHEEVLEKHQLPLEEMERKLEKYSAELEALTVNIVREENGVVTVNQAAIEKQAELTRAMEEVIAAHELDIRGIETNADEVEKKAKRLDAAISASLEGFDYDQVLIQHDNKIGNRFCERTH